MVTLVGGLYPFYEKAAPGRSSGAALNVLDALVLFVFEAVSSKLRVELAECCAAAGDGFVLPGELDPGEVEDAA